MSKKLSSLDGDEREKIENELETSAKSYGVDAWSSSDGSATLLESQIGICATCKDMSYCKSEFGNIYAKCLSFRMRLTGQNRMVECNDYTARGKMSLTDMYAIATLVSVSEPEIKGFISTDAKLRKKRVPAGFATNHSFPDYDLNRVSKIEDEIKGGDSV